MQFDCPKYFWPGRKEIRHVNTLLHIIRTDVEVESYKANQKNQNTDPLTFIPQPIQDPGCAHAFPSSPPTWWVAVLQQLVKTISLSTRSSGFPKVAKTVT